MPARLPRAERASSVFAYEWGSIPPRWDKVPVTLEGEQWALSNGRSPRRRSPYALNTSVVIWRIVLGAASGLLLSWCILVVTLFRVRPTGASLNEALRLLPDTLRLIKRLATDDSLPKAARALLWCLLAYLALPFDLIPDFIPVIGFADDAIIVCWVLRAVVRRAGSVVVRRHWPGTEDGLAVLWRVASLDKAPR